MTNDLLLRLLLLTPITAATVVAALGPARKSAVRWISLIATLLCGVMSILLAVGYIADHTSGLNPTATTFNPVYTTRVDLLQVGSSAIQFYIGLDGLNLWLVVLTCVLMISAVLASWRSPSVQERSNEFFAWLLALQAGMLGVFLAFDIILFYVFFELTLVPLFFLIGVWGGPERRHAARKFFIFTLTGSVITFLGLLGVVAFCYAEATELTFSIPQLIEVANRKFGEGDGYPRLQFWIFAAMMTGFAVKVPLVPVHTWLPLAHVEAPTAGSVLLAGVLLKIGSYGFLRLCLPLAPDACYSYGAPLISWLAIIGIIYGAIVALAQEDIKKLVAYSSVSHLGFCMLGMFALNSAGIGGSVLQMINHGLSTGGLFLLVGMLYDRYHTRQMADYGGLAARLKLLSLFMVFICLTSIGLPGLNGFVGEALVFMGAFAVRPLYAVLASAGVVLGAWYLLHMLLRVFFGPIKEPHHDGPEPVADLNVREVAALAPIAVLCIVIGVYPLPILKTIERDVEVVVNLSRLAKNRVHAAALADAERQSEALAAHHGEEARR